MDLNFAKHWCAIHSVHTFVTIQISCASFSGFGGSLRRLVLAEKTSQASLLIMNTDTHNHTLIVPKTPERHQHPKILHTQGTKGLKSCDKKPHTQKKPFWPPLSTACQSQQVAVTNLTACVLSHKTLQHVFPPPCYSRPPSRLPPHAVQTKVFILAQKSQIKV